MTQPLCKVCGRPVTGVKYGRPYATCSRECGTAARRQPARVHFEMPPEPAA